MSMQDDIRIVARAVASRAITRSVDHTVNHSDFPGLSEDQWRRVVYEARQIAGEVSSDWATFGDAQDRLVKAAEETDR